jgi:Mo25-like
MHRMPLHQQVLAPQASPASACVQRNALEASDAFHSLRTLLDTHKEVTTAYLSNSDNYDGFFRQYESLLTSSNYATQRQVQRSALR